MSRSRKKEPFYKDPNNTQGKKIANRKLRHKVKVALQQGTEDLPLIDEVENSYNFLDFKTNGHTMRDKEYAKELKRK